METNKNTDRTFFTNEPEATLLKRFQKTLKNVQYFDVLVGYFYTSGFYKIYKSLNKTKKIRILIGISTGKETYELIQKSKQPGEIDIFHGSRQEIPFSHSEVKEHFSKNIKNEMENSEDIPEVEQGVKKFVEYLKNGKLEIKVYKKQSIHAKLYIMTFVEGDRDIGRIITGSSNFTKSGLVDNLEFNVELKNRADYEFALQKFNELWKDAVDVSDEYIEAINKTWIKLITPYNLYLKFLYEYFKDELNLIGDLKYDYKPDDFMQLDYQDDAVLNAKKILSEYGGVFLSDVVGLGKTYMSAMLAKQLDGRNLVVAPPVLLDKDNPSSWVNIFHAFDVASKFESIGKLDHIIKMGTENYKNIFIDEAHRFRTETNVTYEKIAQICRGKRVILVTATPLNNTPKDILSQIKLFQKTRKSNIPGLQNLENFFNKLEKRLKNLDRKKDRQKYLKISRENSKLIRQKVIKHLMVRRTRKDIENYFKKDLKKKGFKFPKVSNPKPVYYELNEIENEVFDKTIKLITEGFNYARYTPIIPKYYKGEVTQPEELGQKNMRKFMKILLVKRLESSFYAFRKSIDRFILSYVNFIKEFENGNVYTSKKYTNKIFEYLESDDDESIQKLIDEDKAKKYSAKDFNPIFKIDLENDLEVLKQIQELWKNVKRDPKIIKFINILKNEKILKSNKLIIFTESKETAEYIAEKLDNNLEDNILLSTGKTITSIRNKVIENFDPRAKNNKDRYRILVSTEVLSEGINLHRSNVVINYDIPWNPTRLKQRAGRINRVDTKFDEIFIYNFFPTTQSNEQIKLKEAAIAKIESFISLLGNDAKLLTDDETIESHELFDKLISSKTITDEDEEESSLKYLNVIKKIREENPDLFSIIKKLPKKARSGRKKENIKQGLLTYFRKGKLQKFYISNDNKSEELDFLTAAKLLEADENTKLKKPGNDYYDLLKNNKQQFYDSTTEEIPIEKKKGGRDRRTQLIRILKALQNQDLKRYTDDQELYLQKVIKQVEEGGLTNQTLKVTIKALNDEMKNNTDSFNLLKILQKNIPDALLKEHISESSAQTEGPREVILSEYFIGE